MVDIFESQPIHIAKFMQLERNVQHVGNEMSRLFRLSGEQEKKVRELYENRNDHVSHAELLAVVSGRKAMKLNHNTESNDLLFSLFSDKMDETNKSLQQLSMYIFLLIMCMFYIFWIL